MFGRRISPVVGVIALAALALLALGTAASAETVILPKDADGNVIIEMTSSGDTLSGGLTVVNPAAGPLTARIRGSGAIAQCTFADAKIPGSSTTDITVKSDHCTLDKGGAVGTITFQGTTATQVRVLLKPKTVTKPVSLGATFYGFLFAAAGAALLLVACWLTRPAKGSNKALSWSDELPGLPAGWTFTDSWATNVGVVSTGFVAIFGTNDVVTALVGDESETLPGRLLITAAISALLIGIAPVVLKSIGPRSTATVSGMCVAAWLTTAAVGGQVLAVYAAFGVNNPSGAGWTDFIHGFGWNVGLLVAVLLLFLLAWYVYSSIRVLLAFPPATAPTPSDEMLIASATLLAAEICCKEQQTPYDPDGEMLSLAYTRAVNHLQDFQKKADVAKQTLKTERADATAKSTRAKSSSAKLRRRSLTRRAAAASAKHRRQQWWLDVTRATVGERYASLSDIAARPPRESVTRSPLL